MMRHVRIVVGLSAALAMPAFAAAPTPAPTAVTPDDIMTGVPPAKVRRMPRPTRDRTAMSPLTRRTSHAIMMPDPSEPVAGASRPR